MRRLIGALGILAALVLFVPPAAVGDERADWGVAVSVGWQDMTLLVENIEGYQLLAVDPGATIVGAGLDHMTFTDIRPGDRVDYQVADFAGMNVVDVIHVTPNRRAELH